MRALSVAVLGLVLAACSSGGGSSGPPLPDVSLTDAVIDPGTAAATCPGGTDACGTSGFCCPTGSDCLQNTGNVYGCGAGYCCLLGCTSGTPCGGGCCATGSTCVGNPGGATGCSTGFCCSPTAEEECPLAVEAQCAAGTRCLLNHSAKSCSGRFACYLPSGVVGCPGENLCPNSIDFCPSGTFCGSTGGVCPVGSSSGNYCCKTEAQANESCDEVPCAAGLSCLPNPHCGDSPVGPANVCHGSCGGQTQCGNYCCPPTYPYCSAAYECWCSS
jgi:hypothetical protein